eukprot:gb/GEZN01007829.1/.p1 GENE.gb/GEZN01007829.1/~~gb/GEZN01007829.1/.p1  ORF type:complete len:412 (-),score=44.91 gb/GEZN01007829.1/:230-1465(-)
MSDPTLVAFYNFEKVWLVLHRIAFYVVLTRLAFAQPFMEALLVLGAMASIFISTSQGFGETLEGFVLAKFLTIFLGRFMFVGFRVFYHHVTVHVGAANFHKFKTEERFNYITGVITIVLFWINILEAVINAILAKYYVGAVAGIALLIPVYCLPGPTVFHWEMTGYYYGHNWAWIMGYMTWNIAFTLVTEHNTADLNWDLVLTNIAGLVCDLLNAVMIHPTKWLHSRTLTLMWTLTFTISLQKRPLGSDPSVDETFVGDKALQADIIGGVLAILFCLLSAYLVHTKKHKIMRYQFASEPWWHSPAATEMLGFVHLDVDPISYMPIPRPLGHQCEKQPSMRLMETSPLPHARTLDSVSEERGGVAVNSDEIPHHTEFSSESENLTTPSRQISAAEKLLVTETNPSSPSMEIV